MKANRIFKNAFSPQFLSETFCPVKIDIKIFQSFLLFPYSVQDLSRTPRSKKDAGLLYGHIL